MISVCTTLHIQSSKYQTKHKRDFPRRHNCQCQWCQCQSLLSSRVTFKVNSGNNLCYCSMLVIRLSLPDISTVKAYYLESKFCESSLNSFYHWRLIYWEHILWMVTLITSKCFGQFNSAMSKHSNTTIIEEEQIILGMRLLCSISHSKYCVPVEFSLA